MKSTRATNESGMTMVLVITVLAAMLAGGAVVMSMSSGNTRSASLTKQKRSSLYCAEAGLAAARDVLVNNQTSWNDILQGNPPAGLGYPFTGDLDGDGTDDYEATIRDDGDDADFTTDSNQTVIVQSECLAFPNAPAQIIEVISMAGTTGDWYGDQKGQGPAGTGQVKEFL